MNEKKYDNASQRMKASGYIYNIGAKKAKEDVLNNINDEYSELHQNGKIHIHDLETYEYTYNCLQMDIIQGFPFKKFSEYSNFKKISEIFNYYKKIIIKLGHEQSGGIGFPNFDEEIYTIFKELNIENNTINRQVLKDSIESFVDWLNEVHVRNGQYSFYVTLNLGLSTTDLGRFVTKTLITYFMETTLDIIKPNIIFKIKKGINYSPEDKNYDLFNLAIKCTCKKMIPTYLLFDSKANEIYDPNKVAIMGCRTKVVANIYGESRSVGRPNIDYISINLPRIALEIEKEIKDQSFEEKIDLFKQKWKETADLVKDILIHRYKSLLKYEPSEFPCNYEYNLMIKDFKTAKSLEDIFKNGTFSVGFIGLSEAFEILSGEKYYSSEENINKALDIVKYMREVVDSYIEKYNMNFTLLASSGELISGRFPELDQNHFKHDVIEKEFYTNSFHVDVDSGMHPVKKIQTEGPFHIYCNGGCISYVEFSSAPLGNIEAVKEVIDAGIENGVNYLGVNFPLDKCNDCGELGTFDLCPVCGGDDIYRIRRVSGYLEQLDYFIVLDITNMLFLNRTF